MPKIIPIQPTKNNLPKKQFLIKNNYKKHLKIKKIRFKDSFDLELRFKKLVWIPSI